MSTNFAKTLVWKHEYDVKLWRHKQCTPNTNDHHMPLNETTPMKIFCVRHCFHWNWKTIWHQLPSNATNLHWRNHAARFIHFCLESLAFPVLALAFQLFTCNYWLQISELRMRSVTCNRFPIKRNRRYWFNFVALVETSYLNTDMCKFETSQSEESTAQSADSSIACFKPRAFIVA